MADARDPGPVRPGDPLPPASWFAALRRRASRRLRLEAPLVAGRDGAAALGLPPELDARLTARSGQAYSWVEARREAGAWADLAGGRSGVGNAYEYNLGTSAPVDSIQRLRYTPADDWRFQHVTGRAAIPARLSVRLEYVAYSTPTLPSFGTINQWDGTYASYDGDFTAPLVSSGTTLDESGAPVAARASSGWTGAMEAGPIAAAPSVYNFGVAMGTRNGVSLHPYSVISTPYYTRPNYADEGTPSRFRTLAYHAFAFWADADGVYRLRHAMWGAEQTRIYSGSNSFTVPGTGPGYITYRAGTLVSTDPFVIEFGPVTSYLVSVTTGWDGFGNAQFATRTPAEVTPSAYLVAPPGTSGPSHPDGFATPFAVRSLRVISRPS